jgi:hypothetical protein
MDGMERFLGLEADRIQEMSEFHFQHHSAILSNLRKQEHSLNNFRNAVRKLLFNKAQDNPQTAKEWGRIFEHLHGTCVTQNQNKVLLEQVQEDMVQRREECTDLPRMTIDKPNSEQVSY